MTDYVYFIETENGIVKIGKANDVRKRLADLRGSSPIPLRLLYSIDCNGNAFKIEKQFHKMFEEKCSHGEWFRLTKKDKRTIMRMGAGTNGAIESDDYICPDCLKSFSKKLGLEQHGFFCDGATDDEQIKAWRQGKFARKYPNRFKENKDVQT